MHNLVTMSITAVFIFISSTALCETAEEKGLRIATEADTRYAGFKDYTADGRMVLKDSSNNKSERELLTKVLEGASNEGDKTLMVFHTPKDIKGTSLLTWTNIDRPDDQWLYLPALKRVKRIASSNKTGPFMGSEFSYEDLTPRELKKYKYKYLKEEKCGKLICHVIDSFPLAKKSGYTRQTVYLDKKELRMQKIKLYDRKKSHLKTMVLLNYKKYLGKHWAASKVYMKNHQTKKSTIFYWTNYKYETGLKKRAFTKASLKKGR